MKKIIFSIVLGLCFAFPTIAQNWDESDPVDGADAYSSRRGIYLLPEYGDFALGIDATPVLTYLGGFFANQGRSAPAINQTTIYGKYFLADDRAIRVKLNLQMGNSADKYTVQNDYEVNNNPLNPYATVIDIHHTSSFGVGLGAGYEFRRGKGRVQGFYGGEAVLGFYAEKHKFDWANPMTELNQSPSSFLGNRSERETEINPGKTFLAGLGGFVGVEYFFAPQMSLGCEFSLAFRISMSEQSESTTEWWNTSLGKVESRTGRDGDWTARNIRVGTRPVSDGKIYIMFHF